jgi:hypothetical protein
VYRMLRLWLCISSLSIYSVARILEHPSLWTLRFNRLIVTNVSTLVAIILGDLFVPVQ